jgi:signal transduction histidine kinase
LQAMATQVEALDKAVHRIAMELHPRLLDDLGLWLPLNGLEDVDSVPAYGMSCTCPQRYSLEPARTTALFASF